MARFVRLRRIVFNSVVLGKATVFFRPNVYNAPVNGHVRLHKSKTTELDN